MLKYWPGMPAAARRAGVALPRLARRLLSSERSLADLPAEIAERIRLQQAGLLVRLVRTKAGLGACIVLFVILGFGARSLQPSCWATIGLMAIGYGVLLRLSARYRRAPEAARADRFIRLYTAAIALLGSAWGVLVIQLMEVASAPERSLVYGLAVGLICTAALNAPVRVGLAFWLPVSLCSFVGLRLTGSAFDATTALCLLGCSLATYFSNVTLNRLLQERALNEVRLEEQSEVIGLLLRDFEHASSDWLWETDEHLVLQNVSARFAQVAGQPAASLEGTPLRDLLSAADPPRDGTDVSPQTLLHCLAKQLLFAKLVLPVKARGELRWWMLTGRPTFDRHGRFTGYRGVGADITASRQFEERIVRLARYDSLSDLPNRSMFSDALADACSRCATESVAVLFLDLDDFKTINDTLGHAVGDALLVAVAQRLRHSLRESDLASRFGGDEFAVILGGSGAMQAVAFAERLIRRLAEPYQLDGVTLEIGVSIGATVAPRDGMDPDLLLRHADLALYRAKADGKGTVRLFEPKMAERMRERQGLRAELRQALREGEFRLVHQPVVSLLTGEVETSEALLRWMHPTRGLLTPNHFIPVAEEAGLINAMGAWVLREATLAAAHWDARVRVAINLSPVQFRDANLLALLDAAIANSGIAPDRIELELTETVLLESTEQTDRTLRQLRASGVRLVLDDFGTGYASLHYLRDFAFDKLKIDHSYIVNMETNARDRAIVETMIALARRMNMTVTAEGVETREQVRLLTEAGCTLAQGYYFRRPLPLEELGPYIKAMRRRRRPGGTAEGLRAMGAAPS